MRIIIAGAGEVGTHLSKLLSQEDQEIILLDTNEKKLAELDARLNLMISVGSPSSIVDLRNAGVRDADLFIAVTPYETTNITACMLAKHLGAKKTLARVENYEYLKPENQEFFKRMGVNSLIYPELLAAEEIVNGLKQTWVRQWVELANSSLILIGVKIRSNATEILNVPLMKLNRNQFDFHVVAIKRKSGTIIPKGDDMILDGDIVYFTVKPDYMNTLRDLCGKKEMDVRKLFIMGGSRIAIRTSHLIPDNMSIKIVEFDYSKAELLAQRMKKATVIHGDARNTDLLKEEGIAESDAFIALTDNSETNILACLTAKNFGLRRTVAEVENIDYINMAENLDIGTVINKKIIAASHIYKLLLDKQVSNIRCLTYANAEVAEIIVQEGARATRKKVKHLGLPRDISLGGLIRNNEGIIINGETEIQAGDIIIVFFLETPLPRIEKFFI